MKLPPNAKIIRDFSRAAVTYDNHAILQRKVADKLFKMMEAPTGNVLDIGCGTGYFHELLRKNKIYSPLVQTDIAFSMCKTADLYASPPEYGGTYTCVSDMHKLPFTGKAFSSIFSSMTLQWAHSRPDTFAEIARVLKDTGTFAFSIVGENSLAELYESFTDAGYTPPIHKFASENTIATELKQAGFALKEIMSETIPMYYGDVMQILYSIKGVGAAYKGATGGIKGKGYFKEIEKIYSDKFMQQKGLPLSWNIIYVTGKNG